jgi:hypothetical protein
VRRHAFHFWALTVLLTGCSAHHYTVPSDLGTQLYLDIPGARTVVFASSVDAFAPHAARRTSGATWEVTVPGRAEFTYFYVVDGKLFLPECRFHENDDFGHKNCVYRPGDHSAQNRNKGWP